MSSRSNTLFQRANQTIPGGVNSPVRAFGSVSAHPVYVKRGKGAHIWDADGCEYIDYLGSWGPLILGHADDRVVKAISEAAASGTSFGANTEAEVEFAELITGIYPSIEQVRMVSSGTEATMSAIRLARGFTERSKIVKFEGCYHGHGDSFLIKAGSGVLTLGIPGSPGITDGTAADTLLAEFNDLDSVESVFASYPHDIAALIVEPVMGNAGVIPPEDGFLQGLRDIATRYGTILIFDEVITGFRIALGGAQERYGVVPDMTCLGKIIGGGLPVGAFGGRKEIMQHLAPVGPVYQAGTLSGNPLAVAAGMTTVKILKEEGTYEQLEAAAARFETGVRDVLMDLHLRYSLNRVGSMLCLFFADGKVDSFCKAVTADTKAFNRYFERMLEAGINVAPSAFEAAFISTAHTNDDIDKTIEAMRKSLRQ